MRSCVRIAAATALCALPWLTGCGRLFGGAKKAAPTHVAHAAVRQPIVRLTEAQLQHFKPNEGGLVPILMYHDVVEKEGAWRRSRDHFRADLDRLYKEGYRPITLHEYLINRIALPPGLSPVIITFDDARASQFQYLPDGSIDPDSAVGIMQAFHAAHPDFPTRAVFYVLPDSAFGSVSEASKKLNALLAMGYEIGNHTVSHTALRKLSDKRVVAELAGCVEKTQRLCPQVKMESVALPYGSSPRNKKLLAAGEANGVKYRNRAVLLVGANPAVSPISHKFNPMKLPRIQAYDGPLGITYWLNDLKEHSGKRYVSDGDPGTITIPETLASRVDRSKLQGATLRTY